MTDPEAKNIFLAMCKEKLKLSRLFRWNAAMKHGVPELLEIDKVEEKAVQTDGSVTVEKTEILNKVKDIIKKRQGNSILKWLIPLILATLLAILGTMVYFNWQDDESALLIPDTQDSALQWLEDNGEHLP